jgi:hypothetical protein
MMLSEPSANVHDEAADTVEPRAETRRRTRACGRSMIASKQSNRGGLDSIECHLGFECSEEKEDVASALRGLSLVKPKFSNCQAVLDL